MSVSGKKVAKNVGVLMSSQLITWGLTLVLTIFLPRYLGATGVGQYYIAWALWGIAAVLISFGMDTYLTKAVARNREATTELLGTSLFVRGILYLAGIILVGAYLFFSGRDIELVIVVGIIGVAHIFLLMSTAFIAVLQGLEAMEYVSIGNIASKGLLTVLSLIAIFSGLGLYSVATVAIISSASSAFILYLGLRRATSLRLRVDLAQIRPLLRASAPYLVVSLTLVAYQQINTLVIATVIDEQSVGWYSTSGTLFGTLLFVPVVFATAIFPAVTRSYASSPEQMPKLIRRSIDLMLLIAIPISIGIMVIAPNLIELLYGPDFTPAGQILIVMAAALPFTYLNILYGQLLIATDRPNLWTKTMVAAVVVMFISASLMVPWSIQSFGNGAIGGALSFLLTEFGMTVAGTFMLPKGLLDWSNVRTAALTIVAGVLMMAVSWWFRGMLLPIPIVVGAVTFSAMVLMLRIVPKEDFLFFRELLMQLKRRVRPEVGDAVGLSGR